MIAWAHGTAGVADQCAPSLVGTPLAERDQTYLAAWLAAGYAIVASDYTGLGTPGVMPYLNGKVTAHNIVDLVSAVHAAEPKLFGSRWAVVGQSQGAAAAVFTARYATAYEDPSVQYAGAVATGVPAYVENLVELFGPRIPPFALTPDLTMYALYILAGLRASHPELNFSAYLTASGRSWVAAAEGLCPLELRTKVGRLVLGNLFARPLSSVPNFKTLVNDYMALPETGYDRPLFVGQGLLDTDVPTPLTLLWTGAVTINRQPIVVRTYLTDHSGTMAASLPDSRPFLHRLFYAK